MLCGYVVVVVMVVAGIKLRTLNMLDVCSISPHAFAEQTQHRNKIE